ncbi:hypothetical protein N5P37_004423 [Trichoderma harzianum]|nr:hypothetical protein N5P37_004423 [Trichoderma harzianum]
MLKTGAKYSGLGPNAPPATRNHVFIKDIALAFAVSVLPLLAFSGLLLGLLFWYRVIPHGRNDPRLPDENPQKKSIVFISLSATVFTTVGSWSSTVAPLSLPFILTIASYPASRLMMRASDGKEGRKLPTPYQIALILRVMSNSSLSSVWQCMNYISAKGRRAPMSSALNIMMCTLVLGTIQSTFIVATDTWLHVTTETVPMTEFHTTLPKNATFGIRPACFKIGEEKPNICNTFLKDELMKNDRNHITQEIFSNISDRVMVQNHDEGGHRYAYIASPAYRFQTDIDYVATTFAVKTNCTPATSRCFKNRHFPNVTSYKCDFAMDEPIDKTMNFLTLTDFTDSTLSSNPNDTYHNSNPHNFAAILNMGFGFAPSGYADSDEVYSGPDQPTVIIMLCESTVFDTEYGSANGSVTHFSTSPSNFSSTNVIAGTLRFSSAMEYFLMHNTITDFWESKTAQQLADRFSNTYSQAILASAGAALEPRPAELAQRRSSILVAAVPVAPLVCLLVANVLVVLLATVLTAGALMEVTKSDEVGDVQTRLSIDALVAAHFETRGKKPGVRKIEDMFEEYQGGDGPRVKVEKTTEESWKLVSCDS